MATLIPIVNVKSTFSLNNIDDQEDLYAGYKLNIKSDMLGTNQIVKKKIKNRILKMPLLR